MSIQNARSNTSGNAPSTLQDGQIALNQADGVLYSRNVDGSIRRQLLAKRYGVSDVAFPIRAFDTYVGIANLTASRTITLPAANNYPAGQVLTIADESGAVTASVTITVAASGSDTINGATNLVFNSAYFGAQFVSNGSGKWVQLLAGSAGGGAALLYTPQTLSPAQQLQTLLNLGLQRTNFWMTEIQAAANKGSYFGLLDGIADGFADNSGIDTANAQNASVSGGAVVNAASDAYTKALLHLDGANGSTTTTDVGGHAVTFTGSGTISTAQSKFGGASYLNASSSYLTIAASADFQIFGGDWTVEGFFYLTAGSGTLFTIGTSQYDRMMLSVLTGSLTLWNGNSASTTGSITTGSWNHVAVVRYGNTVSVYVNGTSVGSISNGAFSTATTPQVFIGSDVYSGSGTYGGYVDEFRISKGIARYTANFTPPSSAFTAGSSGVLILPSINYALQSVPTKGSIRFRAKATADVIAPNTNLIASLSRNGAIGGSNSLDVTLAQTAVLPDGYAHYEANEVDLTGLASGSTLKGQVRTVGLSLGVSIDGWRIRAA